MVNLLKSIFSVIMVLLVTLLINQVMTTGDDTNFISSLKGLAIGTYFLALCYVLTCIKGKEYAQG